MDRIKEALGMGPGTFVLKLDTPAIPAGGFVRGTYACKLKKATDVTGLLARATALRAGKVVYEQTQHLDGQPNVTEGRWTLVFRIPREIQLAEELLPSELRELIWTISVKIQLGLKSDPESSAGFDVVGAFPDGVPTAPGAAPVSGTSLERVVNVLAADTAAAANRVSEMIINPHAKPVLPDYEKGHQQSSRQAEARAEADAQEVRQRMGVQPAEVLKGSETQILRGDDTPIPLGSETQILRGTETQILHGNETQPLEPEEAPPARRRVEKPPIRIDEPIVPRAQRLERQPLRVKKPPIRVDEPSVLHEEPAEEERPRRRVEKPPIRIDEPIVPRAERRERRPLRVEKTGEEPPRRRVEKPPIRVEEPIEPPRRRVEKPPVRVEDPIVPKERGKPGAEKPMPRKRAEDLAPHLPEPAPDDPPRRRVEKPPVQSNPKPSRLPQPNYESDKDLRWKKPGKKK